MEAKAYHLRAAGARKPRLRGSRSSGAINFIQDPTGMRCRSILLKLIVEHTALVDCLALHPRRRLSYRHSHRGP